MATVPTKGNLINAKKTLKLSLVGYELLDKKKNILMGELMSLVDSAKETQDTVEKTFNEAYQALQRANIETGIDEVEKISYTIEIENRVSIKTRSVMGTQIPVVIMPKSKMTPVYSFASTSVSLDIAREKFNAAKNLLKTLAQTENSIIRLAESINKTQKRANALKNIIIPRYDRETNHIQNILEERDREEFSRLKVIKNIKHGKQ